VIRFTLFSWMWVFSTILHQINRRDLFTTPLCAALTVLAFLCLVRPSRARRFVLFNFVSFLHYFIHAPKVGNHELITFMGEIAILIGFAVVTIADWRNPAQPARPLGERLMGQFEPPLRLIAISVYIFAFFHKLNTEYLFDRTQSCGALLPASMFESWPQSYPESIDRVAPGLVIALITMWGSLLLEGLVPVLLAVRRFNLLGVCLGFGFHLFLGIFFWWHFSPLQFALYFLFLPREGVLVAHDSLRKVKAAVCAATKRDLPALQSMLEIGAMVVMPILALLAIENDVFGFWLASHHRLYQWQGIGWNFSTVVGWGSFCLYALLLTWIVVRIVRQVLFPERGVVAAIAPPASAPPPAGDGISRSGRRRRLVYLLVWSLVLLFNGLCPHIGLKTTQSFSMFSNLKTEGGQTNHVIIPASWQIFDYQKDTVFITAKSKNVDDIGVGWTYPYFEFRNRLFILLEAGVKDMSVSYIRNGELHVVPNVELDPELSRPIPWLVSKMFTFIPLKMKTSPKCGSFWKAPG
jgi:hypothetical protein